MKASVSILIILALVVAIVPQFTDCQSQGRAIELPNGKTIPMKCHWTARGRAGPGCAAAGRGDPDCSFSKRKENLRSLSDPGHGAGPVRHPAPDRPDRGVHER